MSLTYGGIPLSIFPDDRVQDLDAFIAGLPVDEIVSLGLPLYAATTSPWFDISAWDKPEIKLGNLRWPSGASRWATANILATDSQLARIRPLVNANSAHNALTFTASDGERSISTSLYMLSARPIGRRTGGNGLNLLQLVDDRWRWHHVAAQLEIDPGVTTWADLFGAIGIALGISIAVPSIDSAFLKPSPGLTGSYDSLPLLLDAAAYSVGLRVVRTLAGAVSLQSATTAAASIASQIEQTQRPVQAGGQFALKATVRPNDISSRVPAQVVVRFPAAESGTLIPASTASTVTLASLALSGYTNAAGFAGSKLLHSTCIAHTTASVPDNAAETTALATALAREYYRWALCGYDIAFAAVADWTPEGSEDYCEWAFHPKRYSTRVQSGDAHDFATKVYHYGTYNSSDQSGIWLFGDLWWGQPTAGGGGVPLVTAHPITGVGTVPDPVTFVDGTSAGQVWAWTGTSWTLASFAAPFSFSAATYSLSIDSTYLSITSNTLTFSSAAASTLTAASTACTLIPCRVRDNTTLISTGVTHTGNTLEANANGTLPQIDFRTLVVGDYVCIYPGSAQTYNGPWKVTSLGSGGSKFQFIRPTEFDTTAKARPGIKVNISDGDTYATQMLELVTQSITLNSTAIDFTRVGEEIRTGHSYVHRQVGENLTDDSTIRSTDHGTVSDWAALDGGVLCSTTSISLSSASSSISLSSDDSRILIGLWPTASGKGLRYIGDADSQSGRTVILQNRGADSLQIDNYSATNGILTTSGANETLTVRSMAICTFDTDMSPNRWRCQIMGSSASSLALDDLTDVSISGGLAANDAIVWDSTINLYTNKPVPNLSPHSIMSHTDAAGAATIDHVFAFDGTDWISRSVANCFSSVYPGAGAGDVWSLSGGTWQPVAAATVKAAIVPDGLGNYVGLSCVEAPDVRFEMVTDVQFHNAWSLTAPIDPTFLAVCEPGSIVPVGLVPERTAVMGASVKGGELFVESQSLLNCNVVVKLSGIRKGLAGNRFPQHTEAEMRANNQFWSGWKKSPQQAP